MAKPIKSVPKNKKVIPNNDRVIKPINNTHNDINIVRSIPNLLAIFGAKGDNKAKASNGNVVIAPATVLLIPRSSRIDEISAPTDVSGARKLEPTKIIPINNNHCRSEERRVGKESKRGETRKH